MALPKLNIPTYELKLPSTGKTIKYRPFVVKERSILLLAIQSENTDSILNALDELFGTCTFGVCKLKDMPIVDSEFLFINIRNKSIGEDLDLVHTCECGTKNDTQVSLDALTIEGVAGKNDIDLGNNIFLKMKYPTLNHSSILTESPTEDGVLEVIASCIDTIIEGDMVYKAADNTLAELKDFVLGLTQLQLDMVQEFFANIPKIVVNGKYTCKKCNKENTFKIEGLENFFA
jgi:hypothetical protein